MCKDKENAGRMFRMGLPRQRPEKAGSLATNRNRKGVPRLPRSFRRRRRHPPAVEGLGPPQEVLEKRVADAGRGESRDGHGVRHVHRGIEPHLGRMPGARRGGGR